MPSNTPYGWSTLARRGALATVLSVVANVVVLAVVTSLELVPPIEQLAYPPVVFLTTVGAVGGTGVYALVQRWSSNPRRTFGIIAGVVLLLSFVPDVTFVADQPGATTGAVATLMVMHVVAAVIVFSVLTR